METKKTLGIRKIVKTSGTHNEEKGLENLTLTGTLKSRCTEGNNELPN